LLLTLAERILSLHSTKGELRPGEFVEVDTDLVLANDITAPLAIEEFRRMGAKKVFNPQKVVMVSDHFVPAKDISSAEQDKMMREFSRSQNIIYFPPGRGIEHVILPEEGLVLPGYVVVGADSHTSTYGALGAFACGMGSTDIAYAMALGKIWMKVPSTLKVLYHGKLSKWVGGKDLILYTIGKIGVDGAIYKALEFWGEAVRDLPMDDRFTMANMAVEAGAKVGIFPPDKVTTEYVGEKLKYPLLSSDEDAEYERVVEFDTSLIEPQVSFPSSPGNAKPISKVGNIEVDQVVIGSCTNGRLSDLRVSAAIIKGKKTHPHTRLIIIPGSQKVYLESLKEGIIEAFIEAGGIVSVPTCGPCLGGHMGVLASGEICIATTNRNFVGRMGSPKSEVYLASPAVAAASAILGRIGSPDEVLGLAS
jgi:3-isopropylmalate/(R)-2-methylmalate dehydratase large subunit